MGLTKYRLGDLITPYAKKCNNPFLTAEDVSGVNREREFFEPSQQVGANTSAYKVVPQNYFACNLMHVGRDEVLPIAWNHTTHDKIVSPAYTVFCIKKDAPLLSEYFFMALKSTEKDRYFWFQTDTSVRDGMSWSDFCNVEISIPSLPIQQKYVDIYSALLRNQRSYERGLDNLKLAIDAQLDEIKDSTDSISVDECLEEVDIRNSDNCFCEVYGVNKEKTFMPSVAVGADLSKYKIVDNGQFACNLMHVGRDVVVPIALNSGSPLIVSPAYLVMKLKTPQISAEYVLMWLSRTETDRKAWFMTDTNVRSGMEKKRFLELKIPTPSDELHEALVDLFRTLSIRRRINERLKAQLRDICPILIKGAMEEATA